METILLEPVDALTVTTLVDNVTDSLLVDHGPANRPPMAAAPRVPARFLEGGRSDDALRGEHGFSVLVTVTTARGETRVLFDAGRTPDGLVANMRRLELSPHDIDVIVLSHGHWDHTTGMDGLVRELGRTNVPVLIHPEFWARRRVRLPGREPVELPTTSRAALQGAGFDIVEQRDPSSLLDGSPLATDEVDRTTGFERGLPGHDAHVDGAWRPDPLILDDQALVANVRGRGLVVLTGCGHSGIVAVLCLLLAPVAVLAPALGEGGRAAFRAWDCGCSARSSASSSPPSCSASSCSCSSSSPASASSAGERSGC